MAGMLCLPGSAPLTDEFAAVSLSQKSELMGLAPNSFNRLGLWRVRQTWHSIQGTAKAGQKVRDSLPKGG